MSINYFPTNLNDHDLASAELFDNRSLEALIFLIDHGRELEFRYRNQDYFLSCSGSKKYVSLWCGNVEQGFDSMDALISSASLQNTPFQNAWSDIELQYLF